MQQNTSLKQALYDTIKAKGFASYSDLLAIAWKHGQKPSTMERRLRELAQAELILPVKNEKGHIVGYKLSVKKEELEILSDNTIKQKLF